MRAHRFLIALCLLPLWLVPGCSSMGSAVAVDPAPGTEFRDCVDCPLLVVVPAGRFMMGSPEDEPGRLPHEGPQHEVNLDYPFALGKFEVTFAQWGACVAAGGCNYVPPDEGWGRGEQPVMNINLDQMHAYLHWLTVRTGHIYRLPTEAEWEYAARAGTETAYPWGNQPDHNLANFGAIECCSGHAAGRDEWADRAAPVGSFPPNAFGLHDMHGNVYERVRDCWAPGYDKTPRDGSAMLSGDCRAIGLRGGAWVSSPELIRSAERDAYNGYYQSTVMGFRVLREL